jgi:hypothetical protein
MFAAIDGAISASDRPTACHTESERFSPGAVAEACRAGVVAIATSVSAVVTSSLRDKSRYRKREM